MLISKKIYNTLIISAIVFGCWYIAKHPEFVRIERPREKFALNGLEVKGNEFTKEIETAFSKVLPSSFSKENKEILDAVGIIDATNKERIQEGRTPLLVNVALSNSAKTKLEDMVSRQYFEHNSPDGKGVSDLTTEAGYSFVIVGENLALGNFTSSADMVTAWMESPGHRANILNSKYKEIGVAVQKSEFEGKSVWIGVQHFGSSRSSCPTISDTLRTTITTLNTSLQQQERILQSIRQKLENPTSLKEVWYQNEVKRFNTLVDNYNAQLNESRQRIGQYNEQVRAFNQCIATFQ